MATWYVDSTASGTGAGTSWTNACTTMAAAIALASPGDDFDMYFGHAETQASALTLTFPGTAAAPCRAFSCDRTNSPAQGTDLVAGFACTGSVTSNVLTLTALSVIGTSTTALPAVGNWVTIGSTGVSAQITSITTPWNGSTGVYAVTTANAASGPVTISGASITTTGAVGITINGYVYIYGVSFHTGTGGSTILALAANGGELVLEACKVYFPSSGSYAGSLTIGDNTNVSNRITFINTTVSWVGSTSSGNNINVSTAVLRWYDTVSAVSYTTQPTSLFATSARVSMIYCSGVDFTGLNSGHYVMGAVTSSTQVQLINCKITSGALFGTPTVPGPNLDYINTDSAATGYQQGRVTYAGTLSTETVVVKSGGASDDVTPISWKVVTTANAKRQSPFECFEIVQWVDTTGTSHTATIDAITDTATDATLTNADVWVEAQVLDNASYPIASLYSSAPANQLTAGTTLSASGATWTTTGLTTPNPQKMSVTFTNQIKGYVRFVVKVGRASLATLRVDPSVTIT